MRADQHAFAALDAQLLIPFRNLESDVALFPLRRRGGESAVDGHGADRQIVAFAGNDPPEYLLHEFGRGGGDGRPDVELSRHCVRNFHLMQVSQSFVHCCEVLLHHAFAALAVSLLDGMLDGGDGFVGRQHTANREEAGLHDGVDAPTHAGIVAHPVTVYHVKLELLIDDLPLHGARQVVPDFVRPVDAVE